MILGRVEQKTGVQLQISFLRIVRVTVVAAMRRR
jgi:hypothetical protein